MAIITPSRRVRRTPFTEGVEAAGVTSYTVYNRMLLAAQIGSFVEDYHHLKRHVQMWDVAVERQISIKGADAEKLMKLISPRDMSKMQDDQCFYLPVIGADGGMLNDPVTMKISPDHYWVSLADSDFMLYLLGVADALSLDVEISEADIAPLAIQGPKSDDLMAKIFGDDIRALTFFRHGIYSFEGRQMHISRSGYSKQGGFEIYVEGTEYAMPLWNRMLAEGESLNIRIGCPNLIERVEGGLLSDGNDMQRENTPFEAGLGKFVTSAENYLGKAALMARPAQQMIRPVAISGDIPVCDRAWPVYADGRKVGQITSAIFSPDFNINVSIGMVADSHWDAGTKLEVETQDGMRDAEIQTQFWI